jgi:purine-binding chemotaxis protein CheW
VLRDGAHQLLVFRLGTELFGIELSAVHEVIDAPVLNRVPDMPPALLGVVSVRGELITVYDPTPLLTGADSTPAGHAVLLFVHGGRRIGLAVDDVLDAVFFEESMLRRANGLDAGDRLLRGIARHNDDLIAVLDVEVLVDSAALQAAGERT